MKLVSFEINGAHHIGVIDPEADEIVDLTAGYNNPGFRNMIALIDGGSDTLEFARDAVSRRKVIRRASDTTLLAALPRPRQMRDFAAYEKHLRQARSNRHVFGQGNRQLDPSEVVLPNVWYEQPLYYKCNRFSVIGSGVDVEWPPYSEFFDYELEMAIVIGKGGRDIPADRAADHVFGYMIFNDFSARDAQLEEMLGGLGPAKGKDFDTGNVLGQWLVTKDEIADPYNLLMTAHINGEEWSRGNSGEIYHRFERMIAHVSQNETIYPGEFFGLGTVGSGCGLESGRSLSDGDVVELRVEGLGSVSNRVVRRKLTPV